MNRQLVVSLFLVANAMVVSALAPHHLNRHSLTTVITDDGTQPPAPPPGHRTVTLLADGTQRTRTATRPKLNCVAAKSV
jgi:hypothetical protein